MLVKITSTLKCFVNIVILVVQYTYLLYLLTYQSLYKTS